MKYMDMDINNDNTEYEEVKRKDNYFYTSFTPLIIAKFVFVINLFTFTWA